MIGCVNKAEEGLLMLSFAIVFGVLAYALFFAYDWMNVARPHVKAAAVLFPAGVLLVAIATGLLVFDARADAAVSAVSVVGALFAVASFAAMVWALVFSLPKGTYVEAGERRPVYEGGAYALCRHPGVFFYCCFYVGLFLVLPSIANLIGFAVLCAGNVAYMLLQDCWTFPSVLEGYADYKRRSNMFFPRWPKAADAAK